MTRLKNLFLLIGLTLGLNGCFLVPNATLTWAPITYSNPSPSPIPLPSGNTYFPQPLSITNINSPSAFFGGGTFLQIAGTGFTGSTQISINNTPCNSVTVISEVSIECSTPYLPIGNYELEATDGTTTTPTWLISYYIDFFSSVNTLLGGSSVIGKATGISVDNAGDFYILDQMNSVIRKYNLMSNSFSIVAGNGLLTTVDGIGTSASFISLNSITYNSALNVFYVADGNVIRIFNPVTLQVSTAYGDPLVSHSVDGTTGVATFKSINTVMIDSLNAKIYVGDDNLLRVVNISADTVLTLAGVSGNHYIQDSTDGTGNTASFASIKSFVFDNGEIYILDGNNLRLVSSTSGATVSLTTTTSAGYLDGTFSSAKFNNPSSLTFDEYNNLYVADTGNNAVRKVNLNTNIVSTVSGGPSLTGNVDGTLSLAQINSPQSVLFFFGGSESGLYVGNGSSFKIIH
jgi:hypothetical protein